MFPTKSSPFMYSLLEDLATPARLSTVPAQDIFIQAKAPSTAPFSAEAEGRPGRPRCRFNPRPRAPQSEPEMWEGGGTRGGGAQATERGRRRRGRGVGTW